MGSAKFIKKIELKKDTTAKVYTDFCNLADEQGVLRACGSCDDKWLIVGFENEIDFRAWLSDLAMFN